MKRGPSGRKSSLVFNQVFCRKGAKAQRKRKEEFEFFFAAFLCAFAPLREKSTLTTLP
jgi:hypothetical protein